jgi:hypothetical protein
MYRGLQQLQSQSQHSFLDFRSLSKVWQQLCGKEVKPQHMSKEERANQWM